MNWLGSELVERPVFLGCLGKSCLSLLLWWPGLQKLQFGLLMGQIAGFVQVSHLGSRFQFVAARQLELQHLELGSLLGSRAGIGHQFVAGPATVRRIRYTNCTKDRRNTQVDRLA